MNVTSTTVKTAKSKQPIGLVYLFFAELWERFSFYGMRALLVLYMTQQLLFTDHMSFGIYAAYMSLVYITPLIGGLVADNILGYRKAIILGGIFMALGHFFLTIEQPLFFYGSLSLIIVGNGFFKPNISSLLGTLYSENDPRRDSGFTIFYMGINIGGAVAPLLCAWLANLYGWHYGFMLAGIGMLAGLLFFNLGQRKNVFGENGKVPNKATFYTKKYGLNQGHWVTLLSFLSVPVFALLVKFYQYEHYLVWLILFLLIGVMTFIYRTVNPIERKQLLVVIYFTTLGTLFWAIFEQAGSSITLFADRNVNLVGMTAAQTNSINSGFIILLAIPFSMLWTYLSKNNINPNSPFKFGIGMLLLGLGFVVFAFSAYEVDNFARTPMFYLIAGYFILTVGELFLSPIGLSKMTQLSPPKYIAFIMGVWFTANFFGHFFAGKIAQLTAVEEGATNVFADGFFGELTKMATGLTQSGVSIMGEEFQQLFSYVSVYASFGFISIAVGILALLLSPFVKKLMGEIQ